MARKPNYKFDRLQRERAKAEKKAARAEEKKKKAEERNSGEITEAGDNPDAEPAENDSGTAPSGS